ncbi:hypothetical protein AC579_2263 [Pseudocercospora musae]|uniref:SMODS and SLOG-associating 2TM effector domain-containing protein n=1 Tax=Pseudocercospora musae TaxID=113226 RepID=A0A139IVA7_9PEZI|nr:hypothetical protein AC579_2263 [Pseudocercospora musae]
MHELPKDLTKSLRSWRGSIYGNSDRPRLSDLEKGTEDYGDKEVEEPLSPAESAVIRHPSVSSRSLRHDARQGRQQQHQYEHRPISRGQQHGSAHDHDGGRQSRPQNAVAKRQGTLPPQTPASNKVSVFNHAPKVADPDPAADRLDDNTTPLSKEHFYELIGMKPPQHDGQLPKELAIKHGLYSKIRSHYSYIQYKYRVYDIMTYAFLSLQLLLSAVFIVLGSLAQVDSHIAIAVLGAVSTIIAGSLALMKGQGLPNRLRQIRDDLSNVIFEAEELYWDVAADRPIHFGDIKRLRGDYMRVLAEARQNHPDTFTSTANKIAQGIEIHPNATQAAAARAKMS